MHLESGGTGNGLLALERLPQDLVRDLGVTLRMAGYSDALNSGVSDHPTLEQFDRACERAVRDRHVTCHQQHLLNSARGQDAQPFAQALRIDDPPCNDMR